MIRITTYLILGAGVAFLGYVLLCTGAVCNRRNVRPLAWYFVVTGLGAVVTPPAALAFGNSRVSEPDYVALCVWSVAAVAGLVCAAQVSRLGRSAVPRVLGGLFLAGHCSSLLLLVLLCAGRH
jgi:hypothetical protein